MSRLEGAMIALGRTRHPAAAAVIAEEIAALGVGAAEVSFLRARAVLAGAKGEVDPLTVA